MTSVVKRSFINLLDAALLRICKAIIRCHLDYGITNDKPNDQIQTRKSLMYSSILVSHIVLANRISLEFQ